MGWKISVNFPKRWSIVKGWKVFWCPTLWSHSIYFLGAGVGLEPTTCQSVWPYWMKIYAFGEILSLWQFCEVLLVFGKIMNLLWQFFYAIGKIFIGINGQIKEGLFRVKQAEYCRYPVRLFQYKKVLVRYKGTTYKSWWLSSTSLLL